MFARPGCQTLVVSTRASAVATEIAGRLTAEGFDDVRPVLVQRWREGGLLGEWVHMHAGPGSVAVAPVGALERARLLARLKVPDRTAANVALLGLVAAIPGISAVELGAAVEAMLSPARRLVTSAAGDDARDRAENAVASAKVSRRRREELAVLSERLAGAKEPFNHSPKEPGPTRVERTVEMLTAVLAAADGDASWVGVVAGDGLHLGGMGGVASAAGLDDHATAAHLAVSMEAAVAALFAAASTVKATTPADVDVIRVMLERLAAADGELLAEFATSTSRIVEPGQRTGMIVGFILSQVAMPGLMLDELVRAAEEADGAA